MQVPEQHVFVAEQVLLQESTVTHAPARQRLPFVHATPQLPQWDESFWKSEVDLHVPLQQTLPPVHELLQESILMQFPATQRLPSVHLVPQVPQLSESTRRSEGDLHAPAQQTLPPAHELLQASTVLHCPPTQRFTPEHTIPQPPQLAESV